jgi:hypothetical protein
VRRSSPTKRKNKTFSDPFCLQASLSQNTAPFPVLKEKGNHSTKLESRRQILEYLFLLLPAMFIMRNLFPFLSLGLLVNGVIAADDCQPETWGRKRAVAAAGEIICRYDTTTDAEVSYFTCKEISEKYGISVDLFLALNPDLDPSCENIKPDTSYCLDGCKYSPCSQCL